MKQNQRAVVAGIAAALVNGGRIKNIYSYELSKHIFLSGSVEKRHINVYDYSRSCHVSGNSSDGKRYGLYDYGNSCHVTVFARAIATYNLTLQMSKEIQEKMMHDLGPQLWEREKIALIKKQCHEHDTEWRALLTYAPTARPMVKWRPSSITLGLRCKEPERSLIIEMAKAAGISQIYECYINLDDELARRTI